MLQISRERVRLPPAKQLCPAGPARFALAQREVKRPACPGYLRSHRGGVVPGMALPALRAGALLHTRCYRIVGEALHLVPREPVEMVPVALGSLLPPLAFGHQPLNVVQVVRKMGLERPPDGILSLLPRLGP